MKIVRHAAIDIVMTLFILLVVLDQHRALLIALAVLTGLLLLIRLSVLGNTEMIKKLAKSQKNVPDWFYHLLNGLNVAFLLAGHMWLLAVAWAAIWLLSWMTLDRVRQQAKSKQKSKSRRKKP